MANPTRVTGPELDGRVRRSERSREAIVRALLDLVGEGILQPTAEQVAERAGVGIRTVFRHFSDVENLFAAMAAHVEQEARPLLLVEVPAGGVEERARALVHQRATLFEKVSPFERSAKLTRWRSEFLRSRHAKLVRTLRADLSRWLPELEGAPDDLVEALELAASFEAWDRLRSEQRLGRSRARAAMERTVVELAARLR